MQRIPTYKPTQLVPTVKPPTPAAAQRRADVRFYVSSRWRRLRMLVLREQPLCKCGRPAEHVHHKKPRKSHPELAYDRDNLESLCIPCHNAEKER